MKNLSLIAALFAASALPFAAAAQSNVINFKGNIVASACAVSGSSVGGGAGNQAAAGSTIEVNLGTVSATDIGTEGQAFSGGSSVPAGAGSNITLTFDCANAKTGGATNGAPTKFTVSFNPGAGSGVADKAIGTLALTPGGAENVAIALFQDDKLVNVQTSQLPVKGDISNGIGTMNLRAMYVRSTNKAIKAGRADATLPFTLRYE